MKKLKLLLTMTVVLFWAGVSVSAESVLLDDFPSFGINSIGIYVESYQDERTDNPSADFITAYAMQDVVYFRNTLCEFESVTPKLTTPAYPLSGSGFNPELDDKLAESLSVVLADLGWDNSYLSSFSGGNLKDLRRQAVSEGHDAVLVVRYYPVEYFVPISNYRASYGYSVNTYSANVGKIVFGLGMYPALELIDARTGARIWYSAYYASHPEAPQGSYQNFVDMAAEFFIIGDDAEQNAIDTMINLTLKSQAFPEAADSGARDELTAASHAEGRSNLFWSNDPSYDFYSAMMAVGYQFRYLGDMPVYYDESSYDDEPGIVVATASPAMEHRLTIPFFTLGFGNMSLELLNFYFGYVPGPTVDVSYTENEWVEDPEDPYGGSVLQEVTRTAEMSTGAMTFGFEVMAKYFLRFGDDLSAYIGGQATAGMWMDTMSSEDNNFDEYDYSFQPQGLAVLDGLVINAGIMAGLRWDAETPVELYGIFYPVGPSGDWALTAGLTWHFLMTDWLSPHSRNIQETMDLF